MSKGYALDVREAVTFLRANYADRKMPTDSALARARALLNSADRQIETPSEATEEVLDELHGLFMWGRMMAPLAYVDPHLLGLERTIRRGVKARVAARELETSAAAPEVSDMSAKGGSVNAADQQPDRVPSHGKKRRGPR